MRKFREGKFVLVGSSTRIVTGPMPVAADDLSARMLSRRDALAAVTGRGIEPPIRGVRYLMYSATVYWEGWSKRVIVGADCDVLPCDWAEVMTILQMAGWMIGNPLYDDIGEPVHYVPADVWVWDLGCP